MYLLTLEKLKKASEKIPESEIIVVTQYEDVYKRQALDAPKVFDEEDSNVCAHKHISRGNAEEAIRNSKYVISHHFETPWTCLLYTSHLKIFMWNSMRNWCK